MDSFPLKKSKIFFWLIIAASIVIRIIWSVFFSEDYWGDAYHNYWMVEQFESFGEYIDYKDRHLVWLPAYRWLSILFSQIIEVKILPLLLQVVYVLIVIKWYFSKNLGIKKNSLLILLFWPLPIIFSGLNMPENLSLLTITGIIVLLLKDQLLKKEFLLIVMLSGISAITRHEATAFLGILSLVLFINRSKREALSIVIGVTIGITVFSMWNLISSGDPLFWLTSKFTASRAGAQSIINNLGMWPRAQQSLLAILLILPTAPLILFKLNDYQKNHKENKNEGSVLLSTILFLGIFFLASLIFFHGADPKYLLLAAFPCSLLTIRMLEMCSKRMTVFVVSFIILLIPVYMIVFNFRSYDIEFERNIGRAISENDTLDRNSKLWSDFPTVLYYSGWNPKNVLSTELVLKNTGQDPKIDPGYLIENKIKYLVVSDASHSRVVEFFPFLKTTSKKNKKIEVEGVDFVLVHEEIASSFSGFNFDENIFDQLEKYVLSTNRLISVWEIKPKDH